MADQDEVNPGAIPPKVSPFAKPDGAAPMKPVAPGAPRPITVRLSKPGRPASASAAPEAAAAAVAAPAAVGIATPPPANPHSTSRVPVPEIGATAVAAAPSAIRPVTVRLRPIAASGTQTGVFAPPHAPHASSTQPIAKVETPAVAAAPAISPLQPQSPPTPGSNPLPDGPKPASVAQVQAAKSKTSRISLDTAIGVAPVGAEKDVPKTIRLKRPSDLSSTVPTSVAQKPPMPSVRQTSRIPDSVLPTVEAAVNESASVTQKKTLKIKRPGASEMSASSPAPAADKSGGGASFPENVQMTPLSPIMDIPAGKAESPIFTTVSVIAACAAAVVLLLLTFCLASHAVGPDAGKNALASVKGPSLPWPGRLVD